MKNEMTDYHCHLLPGIDDGAAGLKESLDMARILARIGFTTVYCTPHRIRSCYENDPPRVRVATAILQERLDEERIPLKLVPGCEHYLDEFLFEDLGVAESIGERKAVLVEVPFRAGPELLHPTIRAFKERGLRPLFAHPERCRCFEPTVKEQGLRGALSMLIGKPRTLDLEGSEVSWLQDAGAGFQGNIGSFAGLYGREVRERALLFLRNGVYSCLGSDAHRPEELEEMLTRGIATVVAEVGADAADKLLRGLPD